MQCVIKWHGASETSAMIFITSMAAIIDTSVHEIIINEFIGAYYYKSQIILLKGWEVGMEGLIFP
jgi:hypothetical protein